MCYYNNVNKNNLNNHIWEGVTIVVYYKLRERVVNFICKYYGEDIRKIFQFRFNIDSTLVSVSIEFENGNIRKAFIEFNLYFDTLLIYTEYDKGMNESVIYKSMEGSFSNNIGEYIIHKETGVLYKVIEYRDEVLLLNESYVVHPFFIPDEFLKTDIREAVKYC